MCFCTKHYFNTSHVNVNHFVRLTSYRTLMYFNTSHVNVNHVFNLSIFNNHTISIHLMLMLIQTGRKQHRSSDIISIHLMLMLITMPDTCTSCPFWHFNTSHVNVNRASVMRSQSVFSHFNTSHVNVNQDSLFKKEVISKFQYISC